jgi:hypothetical protein
MEIINSAQSDSSAFLASLLGPETMSPQRSAADICRGKAMLCRREAGRSSNAAISSDLLRLAPLWDALAAEMDEWGVQEGDLPAPSRSFGAHG